MNGLAFIQAAGGLASVPVYTDGSTDPSAFAGFWVGASADDVENTQASGVIALADFDTWLASHGYHRKAVRDV